MIKCRKCLNTINEIKNFIEFGEKENFEKIDELGKTLGRNSFAYKTEVFDLMIQLCEIEGFLEWSFKKLN